VIDTGLGDPANVEQVPDRCLNITGCVFDPGLGQPGFELIKRCHGLGIVSPHDLADAGFQKIKPIHLMDFTVTVDRDRDRSAHAFCEPDQLPAIDQLADDHIKISIIDVHIGIGNPVRQFGERGP
jgi:hypothetical protein